MSEWGWNAVPASITLLTHSLHCRCFGGYQCLTEKLLYSFFLQAGRGTEKLLPAPPPLPPPLLTSHPEVTGVDFLE